MSSAPPPWSGINTGHSALLLRSTLLLRYQKNSSGNISCSCGLTCLSRSHKEGDSYSPPAKMRQVEIPCLVVYEELWVVDEVKTMPLAARPHSPAWLVVWQYARLGNFTQQQSLTCLTLGFVWGPSHIITIQFLDILFHYGCKSVSLGGVGVKKIGLKDGRVEQLTGTGPSLLNAIRWFIRVLDVKTLCFAILLSNA